MTARNAEPDRTPVVTVTDSVGGWFAVCLVWNEAEPAGDYRGFWEPAYAGAGRYATPDDPELIAEARAMAEAGGIRLDLGPAKDAHP